MNIHITVISYIPLIIWIIFSTYYLLKAKNNFKKINRYIFDSVPSIFSTAGILGTFLGIALALFDFNVNDITGSIPSLLSGLTAAFWTSIIGIILSVISAKLVSIIQVKNEQLGEDASNELLAF